MKTLHGTVKATWPKCSNDGDLNVVFCRGSFPIIGVCTLSSECFSNVQCSKTRSEVINFMLLNHAVKKKN
jgi:hypothetical protein